MSRTRNIVLTGFMGTGKTAIGKALADRLERPFIDMDEEIVNRAGKPIPRIFAEDGEPFFRELERQVVIDLSAEPGQVIAAGGGVVINPANIADFSATGLVVCLTATPETILERVKDDTNRPLLDVPDKLARIRELLEVRRAYYDAIPVQIPTDNRLVDAIVDAILARYNAGD